MGKEGEVVLVLVMGMGNVVIEETLQLIKTAVFCGGGSHVEGRKRRMVFRLGGDSETVCAL